MKGILTTIDKIKLFPLWLFTLLPLKMLYGISDFLFLLIYYLVRYRKKIVLQNLNNAFPRKSEKEIIKIARRFYRYLCDYFIESIYLINMGKNECNRRYHYRNIEVIQELKNRNKSIILATSHYGNWEWAANLGYLTNYALLGIYKPLSNKLFNRLFIYIRAKYGGSPVTMKHTLRVINEYITNCELFMLYQVSDQRPTPEDLSFWLTFLNQDTPLITGTDRLARRYDLPVVFLDIDRIKRGYYEITFKVISDQPKIEEPNAITEKYIRSVEKMIHKKPEYWLWSHNRWKFNPKKYKPRNLA